MNRITLTAALLAAMSVFAMAQTKPEIQEEKAIEQMTRGSNPATNPTAKPEIQEETAIEQMTRGSNPATNPTAKAEIQEETAIDQHTK